MNNHLPYSSEKTILYLLALKSFFRRKKTKQFVCLLEYCYQSIDGKTIKGAHSSSVSERI